MKSTRTPLLSYVRAFAFAAMLLPASLFAQVFPTWQGTGTNWSDAANWDVAYGYGQLEWQGAGNTTSFNDLSSPQSQWRLFFSGGTSYTISGNAVSLFDFGTTNGGILSTSSALQTINTDVNFTDNGARGMFILTTGTGGLTFGGTITLTSAMTALNIAGSNSSSVMTFNGPIVGNKGIVIGDNIIAAPTTNLANTRVLFNGSNSYTGTTTIARGSLAITNANNIGTNNLILGLNGSSARATLQVNNSLTRTNTVAIASGSANSQIAVTNGAVFTISTNLTGTLNTTRFGKAGAGTLILAGTASTYAGQLQIGDGTVVIGSSASLGNNTTTANRGIDLGLNIGDVNETNNVSLLLSNGVVLSNSIYVSPNSISGTNYTRTIGIAGSGSATISNQVFLDGNLTTAIGSASTLTHRSDFTGSGGLIKTGVGDLILTNDSSYTGNTVLAEGKILMARATDVLFGANPASFTASSLTISNGGLLVTSNSTSFGFTWNANRGITIGAGGGIWQITGNVDTILAGTNLLNGSGDLLKFGSGTLTLANSNSFSGGMRSTNAFAGILNLNHQFALANSTLIRTTLSGGGTSILNFGSVAGTNFNLGGLAASASGVGSDIALTNTAGSAITLTVGANNQSTTYAGVLSQGGSLVKTGTGTLTLATANTYSGKTTIAGGAIAISGINRFGGTLGSLEADALTISNGGKLLFTSGLTFDTNRGIVLGAGGGVIEATGGNSFFNTPNQISGAGSLTKTGSSILVFDATNTYTGDTIIAQGELRINDNGGLATNSAVQISNSATLNLRRSTNATALVFSNTISGAGALVKGSPGGGVSSADVTLAASNSYTGGTTINSGSLISGTNGSLGLGTLTMNGADTTVRLHLNGTTNTVTGLSSFGTSSQVIQNQGTTGSAGRLIFDIAGMATTVGNTIIRDGTASGFGTLAITKTGAGTLNLTTISDANNYSGGLTINQGTVRYSNASATVNGLGSGTITLAGGSLDFNSTGTLTNAQAVVLSNGTSSTLTNAAGNVTFSGNVSGDGALVKAGAGTTTLSGSNSFTGTTTVSGGQLVLNGSSGPAAGGTTNVVVSSGASLLISQSNQVNNDAAVTLSGGTIAKGSGAISETLGALTLGANSTVDFGSGTGNFTFSSYNPASFVLKFDNFNLGNSLTFASGTFNASQFDFNGFGYSLSAGTGFTITAIPETSTVLAALGLAGLMLWPARRRVGTLLGRK